jgi:hypothetical protein
MTAVLIQSVFRVMSTVIVIMFSLFQKSHRHVSITRHYSQCVWRGYLGGLPPLRFLHDVEPCRVQHLRKLDGVTALVTALQGLSERHQCTITHTHKNAL